MTMRRWGRYPAGMDFISFSHAPDGVIPEIVTLKAPDGVGSRGVLYRKGSEKTVVCLMHPRADMTRHYSIPYFIGGGYAFFAQESRWPGNDVATVHEMLTADVAGAVTYLRERGFENVVLLGNSGAASLYCLYQSQAVTQPPNRLTDTAAGDPYDLNKFEMPPVQGIIFLGAHLGAGKILMTEIDPSLKNENDPLSCDPSLDMYNLDNGFREPPEPSRFSEEFLKNYRAAQSERVARLDQIARDCIARQKASQEIADHPSLAELPVKSRSLLQRRAVEGHYLRISRIEANPAAVDLSLHPSTRDYGSLMSRRPSISNFSESAVKILSPRAWLSSWSGHSSRADLLANLPKIDIPTLVISYTGDNAIFPYHSEAIYELSPAADKSRSEVHGDHFGLAPGTGIDEGGRANACGIMVDWLGARFAYCVTEQ